MITANEARRISSCVRWKMLENYGYTVDKCVVEKIYIHNTDNISQGYSR